MYRTSAAREWTALEAPVQATKMGGNDDLLKKNATTATGMGDGYVKVRKEGGKKTPGQEPKADGMTAVTSPTTRTQCPSLLPSFCSLSSLALSFDASAAPVAATAGTAPTTIKTSHFLLAPIGSSSLSTRSSLYRPSSPSSAFAFIVSPPFNPSVPLAPLTFSAPPDLSLFSYFNPSLTYSSEKLWKAPTDDEPAPTK